MDTTQTIDQTPPDVQNAFTLDDVSRTLFTADDLGNAQDYISKSVTAAQQAGITPIFNFDTTQELPVGFSLAVIPLTERVPGQGNVTRGLCVAAVPSVQTILGDEAGQAWVVKQINNILLRSVKSAATPNDGEITSIPFKVEDFTTSSSSSALAAFNALASLYVKALKEKGLKFMSKVLLRQVFSSAGFAEQQFPRIGQENWVTVIESMKAHAAKEGLEAGILNHWVKTRDTIEVFVDDIDLSDIDGMVK